jgi:hypothetical protein
MKPTTHLFLLAKLSGHGDYLDSPLCVCGIVLKCRDDISFYMHEVIDFLICLYVCTAFDVRKSMHHHTI